jgi:guanylate kinase
MTPPALVFVVSAPSGAGKSTLCQALLDRWPRLRPSVSCTTRAPRAGEAEGKDYYFLSRAAFEEKKSRGDLLEWAEVHNHFYGTPKGPLEAALRDGMSVLLNIDPHGALAVRKAYPNGVLVFILPPSWKELEDRLRRRAQDAEKDIQTRLANARAEMAYLPRYDYAVINGDVAQAVEDLSAIFRAELRRLPRAAADAAGLI